jgi:prepilin-type N-terminal cleavage/methylation domain-containing protein
MYVNTVKNYVMIKKQGFTIVELLIVIVVIGILATITVVAYNGVQAKAKQTTAADNASKVQQVAESINNDVSSYPRIIADWSAVGNVTTKLPAAIKIVNTAGTNSWPTSLTSTDATTTVFYQYCGAVAAPAAGAATGGRIQYWDTVAGSLAAKILYIGTGASGLGVGAGTVCNTWVTPAS